MFFSYLEIEKGLKDNLIFKGSHKLLGHRRNKEINESVGIKSRQDSLCML